VTAQEHIGWLRGRYGAGSAEAGAILGHARAVCGAYEELVVAARETMDGVMEEAANFSETCDCGMCAGTRALRRLLDAS
jgi:hypothetical protein